MKRIGSTTRPYHIEVAGPRTLLPAMGPTGSLLRPSGPASGPEQLHFLHGGHRNVRIGNDGASDGGARQEASSRPTRAPRPSRSASTRSASSPPKRTAAPTASCSSRREGAEEFISGVILFDETIRQSAADGTPFPKLLAAKGIIPGHQGRHGRQGPRRRSGREGHRGPRRPARAHRRVPRARRALRQVARRHHHRRRHSQRHLHRRQRARAGPLRRALRRRRPGADRRARGADGRPPHDRALLRGHRAHPAPRSSRRSTTSGSRSSEMMLKPNMVLSGTECPHAGERRARSPRPPCAASATAFPPRCRASSSSRAARATSSPPRT